jgi:3D (Asp-Asp-Asp) domain-containing protein
VVKGFSARLVRAACVSVAAALLTGSTAGASAGGAAVAPSSPSGGAAIGGLAPNHGGRRRVPRPPGRGGRGVWLRGVRITEYWPAPEAWFVGRPVKAPGLAGRHRIDWLYSAMGVSMQGEGIGLDGRTYHIEALGDGGWVTVGGLPTSPVDGWAAGAPYWRAGGYWRNHAGGVSFPLAGGGWSAGTGRRYVPLRGVTFAPGSSLPLSFWQSIAVDPSLIPLGSRVYIPAYRHDGYGGWFVAQDTGGAIAGRHIDVYRSPPASSSDSGANLSDQSVFILKPRG